MTLPFSGHRGGRAAPLPAPAPQAPPTPRPAEPKAAEPPQVVIPIDDSDDPDTATSLGDDATADEIAAAAGRFRRAAGLAAGRAEQD